MNEKQRAALHELGHAVKHHLHVRQVAEGQGLIPPLKRSQPPQGAPMPPQAPQAPQAPPQPGMQPQPPQAPPGGPQGAPGMPPPPPGPNPVGQTRQTLMSKAPPPIDPTQIASIRNRPRNSLAQGSGIPGRPAGTNAIRG